jgi:signal recognition particle receptor subunit beta
MTTLYVFVTGPSGSGKSSFLQSLGDPADYWTDEAAGLEFRRLDVDDNLEVYLFCALDPLRFDQLLEISERDMLGYVVMVDSTNADTWAEAKFMLTTCRGYARLPTVIAANKQDLEGAYNPEKVGAWIGMDTMMLVSGLIATDHISARNLFLQLLYSVNDEIERLDTLITALERLAIEPTNTNGFGEG